MKVPFFDLNRQYANIQAEAEESILKVLRSGEYIEGSVVKEFETQMAAYLNVKHVITCGNGTDSIRIALLANGIKAGDEVITTSFSFFATAEAISEIGAIPIFADIEPNSLNIDVTEVKKKITKFTKAILIVHIFGLPADMEELNAVGKEFHIPVIEDACQAIGSSYKGKKAGTLGTVGCFSFYPTKNLGGCGDGGMITTDDDALANTCRALKAHGSGRLGAEAYQYLYHSDVEEIDLLDNLSRKENSSLYDPCKYYNYVIGQNSRLDSVQAAVLLVKLKYLNNYNARRREIAEEYNRKLSFTPLIIPQNSYSDRIACWHQYVVLAPDKEAFVNYLNEKNIGIGSFYPVPLHQQKIYQKLNGKHQSLPVVEKVCSRSVCLPIFPELERAELEYIIETIRQYYK